jgi:hypothetical protein
MKEMVMSQQLVSESVLTNHYRCATLAACVEAIFWAG